MNPTMPYLADPLSKDEYNLLKSWIQNGAPDKNGQVKFADRPERTKVYVTNQGCDVVTVFDTELNMPMRYIDVGNSPGIESPHQIKVSPDNKYWYVIFSAGNSIQKYTTADNSYMGEIIIDGGSWNTFTISSDSKKAFIVDYNSSGRIVLADLEQMTVETTYQGGVFSWPHGSMVNQAFTTLYVTAQTGNFIYKIDITNRFSPVVEEISLETGVPVNSISSLDPHEILLSKDESRYYITCQKSNEVRVLQSSNDSLLAVIPVGDFPSEMALADNYPYLLVSCMEDITTYAGDPYKRGSVQIIHTQTNTVFTHVYTGWQPHGIAIDNNTDMVYVVNRNKKGSGGPAPHHTALCEGQNGNLVYFPLDMAMQNHSPRIELSVDPYGICISK